jgi:hypothetical protein
VIWSTAGVTVAAWAGGCALRYALIWPTVCPYLKSATTWFQKPARVAMSALTAGGATWSRRPKTRLIACIVGRRTEPDVDMPWRAGTSLMTAFITLRVVRVSCQISQNSADEAWLEAEEPLTAAVPAAVEAPLGAGLPAGLVLAVEAELPVAAELPQPVSARVSAAVINGVARNISRKLVQGVRFMPL